MSEKNTPANAKQRLDISLKHYFEKLKAGFKAICIQNNPGLYMPTSETCLFVRVDDDKSQSICQGDYYVAISQTTGKVVAAGVCGD
ncbi:MAG: hypothetical protein EOM80_13720 [Erysipelotrichia bacterium]|nr:hypothetical protein [Erysipelotrichia bacterium]